ncbi:MAG: hypothetical protein V1916_03430 [Patescibacteria group bacterium]
MPKRKGIREPAVAPLPLEQSATSHRVVFWLLMVTLWALTLFCVSQVSVVFGGWSVGTVGSNLPGVNSKLGELVGFALAVVMSLYTFGITAIIVVTAATTRFRSFPFRPFVRLHTLVLLAFVAYVIAFAALFVRL